MNDALMNKDTHNGEAARNEEKERDGGRCSRGYDCRGAGGWTWGDRLHLHQKLSVSRTRTGTWQSRERWEERKKTLLGRRGGKEREEGGLQEKS